MAGPISGSGYSGYSSNANYSQYLPPMSGGQTAQSLGDQFNSSPTTQVSAPPKKEGGGLFDKIGATIKGVVKAPGKLVEGAAKALTDPKTLLMGAAAIALAPVTGGGSLVALGAYGAVKSGQAVVQGVGQAAQGWQTGDLDAIENGVASAGAGAGGVALSAVGVKSAIKANPTGPAAGVLENGFKGPARLGGSGGKAVGAEGITGVQALRAAPRTAYNGFKQGFESFKGGGSTLGERASAFKTQTLDGLKSNYRNIRSEAGKTPNAQIRSLEKGNAEIQANIKALEAEGNTAGAATMREGLIGRQEAVAALKAERPQVNPLGETLKGARSKDGITKLGEQINNRFQNSKLGDYYKAFENQPHLTGGTAAFGSTIAAPPQEPPAGYA